MWWSIAFLFTLLMDSEGLLRQTVSSFLSKWTQSSPPCPHIHAGRQAGRHDPRPEAGWTSEAGTGQCPSLSLPEPQAWMGALTEPDILLTICTKHSTLKVAPSHHINMLLLEGEKTAPEFSLIFSCLSSGGMSCWLENYCPEYLQKNRGKSCFSKYLCKIDTRKEFHFLKKSWDMLDIHHYISFKCTIENGHRMVARHKHSSLSFVMSCASATTLLVILYI